jgi:hypothetical protein
MELEIFLKKVPHLYHLTDRSNLDFIKKEKKLISTVELANRTSTKLAKDYLKSRRGNFSFLEIDGHTISVRDQKPLTKALERCLLNGWTPAQWIYHLNVRVFTWPSLKRLRSHFGTYKNDKPIILRFRTEEMLELNKNVELCKYNSGDSRCIGHYDGNPAPRGNDTFKKIADYEFSDIAEVTFPKGCVLPKEFEIGDSPDGPWKTIRL